MKRVIFTNICKVYQPSTPSATENLTQLYGLAPLASSVARFDPSTHEKRKLRKSYKNHISDLPGKHEIPPRGIDGPVGMSNGAGTGAGGSAMPTLLSIVFSQQGHIPQHPTHLPQLDSELLNRALVLDKTPATGIPDFDVSKLAIVPFTAGGIAGENASSGGGGSFSAPVGNGNGGPGGARGLGGGLSSGKSSLHFASRLHSGNNTAAESSNDDSSFMRIPLKKKKKRPINSLSPPGNGSPPSDLDSKRRKKL